MLFHQNRNSRGDHRYETAVFSNFNLKPQFHRNYEVAYVFDGTMEMTVDGRSVILEKGDFAMCLSNEVHEYHTIGESLCWWGVFSPDFVPEFDKTVQGKTSLNCKFQCTGVVKEFLKEHILLDNAGSSEQMYQIKAGLYLICNEYLREATLIERENQVYNLMNRIADYIGENYTRKMEMRDVARELGYDYHYFSRLFRQVFNIRFSDYLNSFRLEAAMKALRSSDQTVSAIAIASGFQSVRNFNTVFHKVVGMTPGQYRESMQQNKPAAK